MDKKYNEKGVLVDDSAPWWKRLVEAMGWSEPRVVEPAEYHTIEARTRAFNRGLRAVRRHRRIGQKYPLPRHIQDKLSMR